MTKKIIYHKNGNKTIIITKEPKVSMQYHVHRRHYDDVEERFYFIRDNKGYFCPECEGKRAYDV